MKIDNNQAAPLQAHYDVVVVGGGLAGCSTAIGLAEAGFSVLLAEKGHYPAHKLCGEFLSPESGEMLDRLGVLEAVAAGAQPIRYARLTSASGRDLTRRLPGTALGVSRYRLDAVLAHRARAAGVEVRTGCMVTGAAADVGGTYRVHLPEADVAARLVVGAFGKRSRLDGRLQRPFVRDASPLVGFKAHFEGAPLGDVIEMHAFPGGYCGLSQVENGRVNVCWLAHADVLRESGGTPDAMLHGAIASNPAIGTRLRDLRRVSDRYEAVAQVSFRQKGLFDGGMCMVGDAAAMITPLCGDGMAMALHTAGLVVPLAVSHLHGDLDRSAFERAYEQAWRRRFARRLRIGRALHHAFVHAAGSEWIVRGGRALPFAAEWAVRLTRG